MPNKSPEQEDVRSAAWQEVGSDGSMAGPVRTCLGCMKSDRKDAMVRIVAAAGGVLPDFEGRKPGRGGYLHPQFDCLERFIRAKVREFRSLRMKIDREQRSFVVERIRERLDRKPALE